jgi:hypothetical protein
MIPIARTENLLIQEVGHELIVYDQDNDSSHCLNPVATRVWELSDGQNTVNDIARQLEKELKLDEDVDIRGLVWLTLEELERYNLIADYLKQPVSSVNVSRRQVIKTATLVGAFAVGSMFPLVKTIVAPSPAMACSETCPPKPPCIKEGGKCGASNPGGGSCCEGLGCNRTSPAGDERTCQKRLDI